MTARFTLEMPDELHERIKEAAGDVPVNRWIRRAIEEKLADQQANVIVGSDLKPITGRNTAR